MAGSSLGEVLSTGQPRILNDLEAYLQAKPSSDATRRIVAEGGRSSLTCPLVVTDQALGFLFFTSRDKAAYRDAHISIFRQIAHQVSVVIAKSRMYERLVAHNRVLLEQTRHLQVLADVDGLTGALTRRAIDSALEHAWMEHVERGRLLGVMLLDVDHFKRINDTRGHGAGDDVLRELARRVVVPLRKQDLCGRYGGEEFLIVAQDITSEQLLGAAERLRRAVVETPMAASGDTLVTVSVGLAHTDSAPASWRALVEQADEALYVAKDRGRNQSWIVTSQRQPA
jgi:diguanylate cyclase (GGDEF)-like protein